MTETKKLRRGFAAMTPDTRRRIAQLGGLAAAVSGNAHHWTSEEAKAAARKRHARPSPTDFPDLKVTT